MKKKQFSGKVQGEYLDIERINKNTARVKHKNGERVFLCPVNLHPFNQWCTTMEMNNRTPFDEFVDMYENYNCTDNKTGKYAAFYRVIE